MKSTPQTSNGSHPLANKPFTGRKPKHIPKKRAPLGVTRTSNRLEFKVQFPIPFFDQLAADWLADPRPISFSAFLRDLIQKGRSR